MKILVGTDLGSYTFNAATREVTISGLNPLELEQVLLITNVTDNIVIYQFNKTGYGGTISGNIVELDFDTSSMNNSDRLQIFLDYDSSAVLPTGAATSALQITGNASLASIDSKLTNPLPISGTIIANAGTNLNTSNLDVLLSTRATESTLLNILNTAPKNYFLEISRGNIAGAMTITKFGLNTDVDTGTIPEDVNDVGGVITAPLSTARIYNINSTSVNDTSAGTGARTVLLRGIDGSFNAVSETITLNGTTNVPTVNSYVHIHLMQVLTSGSTGANVGNILVTAQVDLIVTCQISIGLNQSCSSLYMVPVGYKGYLIKARARMGNGTSNSESTVGLYNKPFGGVFQLKTQIGLNNAGTSSVVLDYSTSAPFILQGKSMTKLMCTSVSNNNTNITGEYDLILIQD